MSHSSNDQINTYQWQLESFHVINLRPIQEEERMTWSGQTYDKVAPQFVWKLPSMVLHSSSNRWLPVDCSSGFQFSLTITKSKSIEHCVSCHSGSSQYQYILRLISQQNMHRDQSIASAFLTAWSFCIYSNLPHKVWMNTKYANEQINVMTICHRTASHRAALHLW